MTNTPNPPPKRKLNQMNKTINHSLFEEVKNLIEQTKNNVAIAVNSSMTMMYWHINIGGIDG